MSREIHQLRNDAADWYSGVLDAVTEALPRSIDDARRLLEPIAGEAWMAGGNKELNRMRDELGDTHIVENFQYSILEIFDPKTKAETILQRESFWKLALDSRRHGMNLN